MPRNGDGSSDNGPIDGHEILHGTKGDKTLQHTQHVAPMPKHEHGEALPGMNASGGAAAPLNDASEEYGASAPRNERSEDSRTSTRGGASNSHSASTGASSSTISKSQQQSGMSAKSGHEAHHGTEQHDADGLIREKAERFVNLNEDDEQQTGSANKIGSSTQRSDQQRSSQQQSSQQHSSNNAKSSHEAHYATERHEADSVDRHQAERYVNLNEDDVQHAGSANKSADGAERSSQRAPKEVGPKEDIEQLHGKASLSGNDRGNERRSGKSEHGYKSGNDSGAKKNRDSGHHEGDLESMRHTAEKYVNLENE